MQLVDLFLALILLIGTVWAVRRIIKKGLWHVPRREPARIPIIPSVLLFLLFVPFQVALVKLWESFLPSGPLELPAIIFFSTLVYFAISLTPPFRQIWKRPASYSFSQSMKTGAIALALAIPIVFLVEGTLIVLLEKYFGIERVEQDAIQFLLSYSNSPWNFTLVAALIAFAIPVMEELIFRGFLQNILRRFLSAKFALPITALIFTLFHYSGDQGASNWIILPALMVLALALSWVYEKSGNLLAPIALHSLFNMINVFTLLLSNEK